MSQRFSVSSEVSRVDYGLNADAQKEWGTSLEWFRFDPEETDTDDLYDVGAPRRWKPAIVVPCLWVIREEGVDTFRDHGLDLVDTLNAAVSKANLRDILTWRGLEHPVNYIKDRVRYDGVIFTVSKIAPAGELNQRDVVVSVTGSMIQQDEYIWDPDFVPPA